MTVVGDPEGGLSSAREVPWVRPREPEPSATAPHESMTVLDVLLTDAEATAFRGLMDIPISEVVDLASAFVVGDPLVQVAAAMLGDRYVDRYAAGRVLGERDLPV